MPLKQAGVKSKPNLAESFPLCSLAEGRRTSLLTYTVSERMLCIKMGSRHVLGRRGPGPLTIVGQPQCALCRSSLRGSFAAQSVSLAHRMQSLLSWMSWRIIICTDHRHWSVPSPAHQYLYRKRGRGNKSTN